ncbi:hypothetical protein [Streptomyces sp. NPDC059802]|uniref:hypothetical protein n=1 Tax=Streptomyces sp. NPDC059802 TaxID=3346952 RepID=UPI00365CED7D
MVRAHQSGPKAQLIYQHATKKHQLKLVKSIKPKSGSSAKKQLSTLRWRSRSTRAEVAAASPAGPAAEAGLLSTLDSKEEPQFLTWGSHVERVTRIELAL